MSAYKDLYEKMLPLQKKKISMYIKRLSLTQDKSHLVLTYFQVLQAHPNTVSRHMHSNQSYHKDILRKYFC